MKVEIKVPPVGESITEATVATLIKKTGDTVKVDEEILELETEKVNQLLFAPAAGVLTLNVQVEEVVQVGQVIGFIETEGAATPSQEKKGSVKKEAPAVSSSPPLAAAKPERGRRERLSKLRRVIAERLMEVKNTTAMLTTFNEVDMSKVVEFRKKEQENFQKKYGIKLGFMPFFVKACVSALKAYPDMNAMIDREDIVYFDDYDIGIAVGTEKGLMVPVIKGCDTLTLSEIEKKLQDFAGQARSGTISVDDLKGGTFTITNGGVFGSLLSTPILNPPQSGILGMHTIQQRPVAIEGKVEIRPMMYLALSYDHRIVDGQEAISFLVYIKKALEGLSELIKEF